MTGRYERQHELWEEIKKLEYDPDHGVGRLIGRLDWLFWNLEQEGYLVQETERRWYLVYSLSEHLRQITFQLWDESEGHISYLEMCRQLLHLEWGPDEFEENPNL